jgi:hypothetical protein
MARKLIAILPLLLLTCLTVRSYLVTDFAGVAFEDWWVLHVTSSRGQFALAAQGVGPSLNRANGTTRFTSADPAAGEAIINRLLTRAQWNMDLRVLAYVSSRSSPGTSNLPDFYAIVLPAWSTALVCGAPVLIMVFQWRRGSLRRADGLCPACGYDLRSSPDRCPECWTPSVV